MTANSGKWQSLFSKVLWVFPLPGVTWGLHRPSQGGWAWSLLQYALLLLLSHFSRVRLCATPQMAAHQALPSLGLSRQEHWSGLPFPSQMHENEKSKWSRSVMSDSLQPHGLQPTRLLCPCDFPGKSYRVGCHCLVRQYALTAANEETGWLWQDELKLLWTTFQTDEN